MRPNYSIIRCYTADKPKVMDLLCDADEYKLINNHIDIVYFNGDTPLEKKQTKQLIENNVRFLILNDIMAESKSIFVDEWFFLS
jgi:hypothetical protein